MIDWTAVVPTALGGAISGGIGLIAVGYRSRKQRLTDQKQWYSRVERLTQRVQRVNYEDWTGPSPNIAQKTCAGVHAELASHITGAPPPVEDDFLSSCERLIAECQKVKMIEGAHRTDVDATEAESRVHEAALAAEKVEKKAQKRRKSVGLR